MEGQPSPAFSITSKLVAPPNACVDVVIAARDRADTIARAIRSALAEDAVRAVIVIDDGSKDGTAAVARQCGLPGKRVIVERMPASVGPSAARNRALELSNAPWVAILDGDDYFLRGRIGVLLSQSDECDMIADDLLQVREDQVDKAMPAPLLFSGRREPFALTLEAFVTGNVRRHGVVRTELGYLKPLVRRAFLAKHNLKYDENLRLGEDYVMYAHMLADGARFVIVPKPGYVSIVRSDSLSAQHTRRDLERLRDSNLQLIRRSNLAPGERRALRRHYSSLDCRVQWLVVIESLKSSRYGSLLAAFFRSPTVSFFLVRRLLEELQRRLRRS
jgi:succinoglycan biosynthesis protein ExoU